MKIYDVSHWTISDGKCGLLLFAQSLEELLATHSHDSHKVPALNFHYLCFEILHVIGLIEDNKLENGNLIPLFAEMKSLFYQDIIVKKFLGNDFDCIFYKKNNHGQYDKRPIKIESSKDVDAFLPQIKKGVSFIIDELGRNNQYYFELIKKTKEAISAANKKFDRLEEIRNLTKIIASELINKGHNQAFIYDCIINTFYDPNHIVESVDVLDEFFSNFSESHREYSVYFPINSFKQKKAFDEFGSFKIANNVYELFDSQIPFILKYECKAIDPYCAREEALDIINICLSVNQFIKHTKYDYNPKYTEVFDKESKKVVFIRKPEAVISKKQNSPEQIGSHDLLSTLFGLDARGLQILQLHSSAMISKNSKNQLINLWTAVEIAVPLSRKEDLSRINQISNVLTATLGEQYFLSLIQQLIADINITDGAALNKIENIDYSGSLEEKTLAVILLGKYKDIYEDIMQSILEKSPLVACRIYSYKVRFINTENIKQAYLAHEERLSQQLMRIYRTRNMLVHDGSSLPYTDYVLQNLHHYIDSFVNFLCIYYKAGYTSVQTIVDSAQFKEQQYFQMLSMYTTVDETNLAKLILRR